MSIGISEIMLSMTSPETGAYLTGRGYTVDGVYEADGVTPRLLSISQVIMALCLQRAAQLENGYVDSRTGKYVDGIIDMMEDIEDTSEQLSLMTQIENEVLDGSVDLTTQTLTYKGETYTYYNFLTSVMEIDNVPYGTADSSSEEFISALESKMDEKNSFSQQTMIELQSKTNKRDQAYDLISNAIKSINTVLTGNVNNM